MKKDGPAVNVLNTRAGAVIFQMHATQAIPVEKI